MALWLASAGALGAAAAPLRLEFMPGTAEVALRGKDAARQVLASLGGEDGSERDLSREVRWTVEPATLASVDRSGRVTPLSDGIGKLVATTKDGASASLPLSVADSAAAAPIHFANQVVPVFTKNGCNGGGCHGKAAGQNGFRLSLLGFEPAEDYEHLVKEARGRRLFPASPKRSLLLTKGTAQLRHGGGEILELRRAVLGQFSEHPQQTTERRCDEHEMLIQVHTPRFQPVDFEELVEELRGTLLQVAELPAFVLVELDVRMAHQDLAGQ